MIALIIAIGFTLSVSAFCSLLEAMLLSTTTAEIEDLKRKHHKRGHMMEHFKDDIEATSSAILSLNTIANTLGSVIVGGIATQLFGDESLLYFSLGMAIGILFFSEILPKNIGIIYRGGIIKSLVPAIYVVRVIMHPLSWSCKKFVQFLLPASQEVQTREKEILLLADKSAKEGTLRKDERNIIANALNLDEVHVSEIMTPRTVVTAVEKSLKLDSIFRKFPTIPFARIPVYENDLDHVVGLIRRRDLVKASKDSTVADIIHPITFIPASISIADALQHLIKNQQQLAVTVDEFGTMSGVVTLEDIFEYIIGKEIFEKDDVAVDMRKLALKKKEFEEQQRGKE